MRRGRDRSDRPRDGDEHGAGQRGPRRRALLIVVVALVLAVGCVVVVAVSAVGVAAPLRDGRAALEAGRTALLEGRLDDAVDAFRRARSSFAAAEDRSDAVLPTLGGAVPVLGRSLRVLAAIGEAGGRLAGAGVEVSEALGGLPGGIEGLSPTDGRLPLEVLPPIGAALRRAEAEAAAATAALGASPSSLVPGPVADARRTAIGATSRLERLLRSARAFAAALPGFAGGSATRRYLFFAEDPAELRGTGGIWGAYAILTADDGRFRFSRFRPVQSIGTPEGPVPPPNRDYARNYGQYGAPAYWLNANMTPDFPSAARATMATWSALGRQRVHGVLAADPFALRDLLSVTGGVRVPRPSVRLTTGNVVPLLANRAFARFPDPRRRKAILGEAARAVVDRFLSLEGRAVPRLRALVRAFSGGHLKLYSTDPVMQRALAVSDVDRSLDGEGGDLLSLVVNAAAGGKVDYYAHRSIRHDVHLVGGGGANATTAVTIENGAPTAGQPRYVIGPHRPGADPGDNIPLMSLFCAATCELVSAERDGEPIEVTTGTELGYRFYRHYFTVRSGESSTVTLRTSSTGAWSGTTSAGRYRLVVLGQTTIEPTHARIRMSAPRGMRFVAGSGTGGLRVDGATATWVGVLGDRLDLDVAFERIPLATRLWRALRDAV